MDGKGWSGSGPSPNADGVDDGVNRSDPDVVLLAAGGELADAFPSSVMKGVDAGVKRGVPDVVLFAAEVVPGDACWAPSVNGVDDGVNTGLLALVGVFPNEKVGGDACASLNAKGVDDGVKLNSGVPDAVLLADVGRGVEVWCSPNTNTVDDGVKANGEDEGMDREGLEFGLPDALVVRFDMAGLSECGPALNSTCCGSRSVQR